MNHHYSIYSKIPYIDKYLIIIIKIKSFLKTKTNNYIN